MVSDLLPISESTISARKDGLWTASRDTVEGVVNDETTGKLAASSCAITIVGDVNPAMDCLKLWCE